MSRVIEGSPFVEGGFKPWPMEGDIQDLAVVGEIPVELNGRYIRNGSNPKFNPGPNYHWFAGDGMLHAFHFEDGKCHYKNRWVRTPRLETEIAAGEALFGGIGPKDDPDPRIEGISGNASNTNAVWHAGRLLSLWEAGPPFEIDPVTLETKGLHDYDGKFKRERLGQMVHDVMTAHPKIDPVTGEWIAFGYSPLPPYLVYHEVDAQGALQRSFEVEAPFPTMLHDFIVSSEHAIFPYFPLVFDPSQMEATGLPFGWEPDRGTHIGILPRKGTAEDVVWIQTDPCFSFHPVNARTDGDVITAELWVFPRSPMITGGEGGGPPVLHRWVIDLASGSVKDEQLDDRPAEFGRIDERRSGLAYRHLYSLGSMDFVGMKGEPEGFNSLFHYDLEKDSRIEHRLPSGDTVGEPIFVPRTPEAAEGDGFVLAIVYRTAEDRSDMLVLDAQNMSGEPLATIQLPHRIPYGFHGNWVPAT